MWKRVVSYLDGRVVYYYSDKEVTYRKDAEPEVIIRIYNKKEIYGRLAISSNVRGNRIGSRRH